MHDTDTSTENTEQEDPPAVDGSGDSEQSPSVDGSADVQEQSVAVRSWESGGNHLQVRAYDPNVHTIPEHGPDYGGAGRAEAHIEPHTGDVRLSEIETFEGYRGQGVASQMLDEVKSFGQEHGASRIYGDNENPEFWNSMQEHGWRTEGHHVIHDLNTSSNTEAVDGSVDSSAAQTGTDSSSGSDAGADSHPEMGKKGSFVENTLAYGGLGLWSVGTAMGIIPPAQAHNTQDLTQPTAQHETHQSTNVCDLEGNPKDSAETNAHDAGRKLVDAAGVIGSALEQRRRNQEALSPKPEEEEISLMLAPPDDVTPDSQEVGNMTSALSTEGADGTADTNDTSEGSDTTSGGSATPSDTPQKTMNRTDVTDNDAEAIVDGAAQDVVDGSAEGVSNTSDVGQDSDQQLSAAVDSLRQLDGLRPEAWQELAPEERVGVLQEVETRMAEVQGRTPLPIKTESLGAGSFGFYDGESITVNADHVAGNELPVQEFVDTVVHEGRHAFQDHAIKTPGVVEESIASTWQENMRNYLSAEEVGQEAYANQPVEADAWNYASSVTNGLYGDK